MAARLADGAGSKLDISDLANVWGAGNAITETDSGTILLNTGFSKLTSLNGISFTVDATSSLPISQLTSLTNGGITVNEGSYTLPNLTNINGSNLYANGGSLTLPKVTTYTTSNYYTYLEATGTGSSR